jgi:hypothetical protein
MTVQMNLFFNDLQQYNTVYYSGTIGTDISHILRMFDTDNLSVCNNLRSEPPHTRAAFSSILISIISMRFLVETQSHWGEMKSQCNLICNSYMAHAVEHFSLFFLAMCDFLWRISYSVHWCLLIDYMFFWYFIFLGLQ